MKMKTEGVLNTESTEDGGQAIICESLEFITGNSDEVNGMFVSIRSWDEDTVHSDLGLFLGKKVRVTIEVID